MPREAYHKDLTRVTDDIMKLATMVRDAVDAAVKSLAERDLERSHKIMEDDRIVNSLRFKIEEECLLLMATQQPMAVDLRTLAASLHIATDLERIGDYAAGIAKINTLIGEEELVKELKDLPRMTDLALGMLDKVMEAYLSHDDKTAREICDEDDEVDEMYDRVYQELIFLMIQKPATVQGATYLSWAAHNIERVADRVTNIAERIVFMVTGKMEEVNVSKF